jgi:hypothetical protein
VYLNQQIVQQLLIVHLMEIHTIHLVEYMHEQWWHSKRNKIMKFHLIMIEYLLKLDLAKQESQDQLKTVDQCYKYLHRLDI